MYHSKGGKNYDKFSQVFHPCPKAYAFSHIALYGGGGGLKTIKTSNNGPDDKVPTVVLEKPLFCKVYCFHVPNTFNSMKQIINSPYGVAMWAC